MSVNNLGVATPAECDEYYEENIRRICSRIDNLLKEGYRFINLLNNEKIFVDSICKLYSEAGWRLVKDETTLGLSGPINLLFADSRL